MNGFMLHLGLPVFTILTDSRNAGCFLEEAISSGNFFFFPFFFPVCHLKKVG